MAGPNGIDPSLNDKINNSLLNNLQGTQDPDLFVNDFNNYTPEGLSPEQQQTYLQQQQAQNKPATGALSPYDYYPDLHHQIGVGSYGGSEVGNLTLFAPGGGLVPLGMMDARDLAIKKVAMQKAQEAEAFKKQYAIPETKHVAVQQALTDNYFNGIHQWEQNALKQANGDYQVAHQILQHDPQFNKWNQSMQDAAKFHDKIVEQSAQLESLEKDPNMVLSPEVRKMNRDVISGIAYAGSNPFSKQGHDIGAKFLGLQAAADLDVKTNQIIDKAIPDIEQLPPTYTQRGKNEVATYLEREYFPPQRVKDMAHNLYMSQYQGTGFSEDDVYKSLSDKIGEKIKRKTDNYDKWYKPSADSNDYSKTVPQVQSQFNFDVPTGKKTITGEDIMQAQSAHMENAYPTSAEDANKSIGIKISPSVIDLQNRGTEKLSGSITGKVERVGTFPYDKAANKFISPEEYKQLEESGTLRAKHIEWRSGAIVNETPTTAQQNDAAYTPNSYVVPVSDVKGKFKGFDQIIDKVEQYTEEKNKNKNIPNPVDVVKQKTGTATQPTYTEKTYTYNGTSYSEDAIKKAAANAGMSMDAYIKKHGIK